MSNTPNTKNLHTTQNHGNIIVPLILIGALIFLFIRVDLKTVFESEQVKKNVNYVKGYFDTTFDKYGKEVGDKFLKTEARQTTNKTSSFNLNNFFPQINNKIVNPNDVDASTGVNNMGQTQTTSTNEGFRTQP